MFLRSLTIPVLLRVLIVTTTWEATSAIHSVTRYAGGIQISQADIHDNSYASQSLVVFENGIGYGVGVLNSECSFLARISSSGRPRIGDPVYLQVNSTDVFTISTVTNLTSTDDPAYKFVEFTHGGLPDGSHPSYLPGMLAPPPSEGTSCNLVGLGDSFQPERLPSNVISRTACIAAWAAYPVVQNELSANPSRYFCLYPTSDPAFTPATFTFRFGQLDLPGAAFCKNWSGLPIHLQIPGLSRCTWLGIALGTKPIFAGYIKYFIEGTGVPPVVVEYIRVAL
ncbi:uncharacterized protein LOC118436748 [Folsomia candida]|uniref:Uncharacterized protein n=1 Tax=Folsomia candida TaxID=158441 RepID=A0A226DX39_FOLCA|nr:uncharacterized protein LOC118436748 [Folsomia candida]OXA49374.1 hypothetical protein Fcan01_15932 [Folsomia candida]